MNPPVDRRRAATSPVEPHESIGFVDEAVVLAMIADHQKPVVQFQSAWSIKRQLGQDTPLDLPLDRRMAFAR